MTAPLLGDIDAYNNENKPNAIETKKKQKNPYYLPSARSATWFAKKKKKKNRFPFRSKHATTLQCQGPLAWGVVNHLSHRMCHL
jgi:hypothetical protein